MKNMMINNEKTITRMTAVFAALITAIMCLAVTVTPAFAATQKTTGKYLSTTAAYNELNKFRTTKKVWQWKADNKSKTYFNTTNGNKLSKLKRSASLEATAKVRAREIAKKYSHTRPNGKDCFTAYPSAFTYRGENLAAGYSTANAVTEAWKETNCKYSGQGHRRIMLDKGYTSVGIACYELNGTRYWVQAFGGK